MLPLEKNFDYLPLFCLLLSLLLVAILNTVYVRKIRTQIEGFVNARYAQQIAREDSTSASLASAMMLFNAMLTTALSVYLAVSQNQNAEQNNWPLFLSIMGGIALVILYFMIMPTLIRFLFHQDRGLTEHRFNFVLIFQVTGLLLIPCTIIASYSAVAKEEFVYITLIILALVYVYRLVRGVLIGLTNRISLIYIILYLCTLEILPIVVLVGLYWDKIS